MAQCNSGFPNPIYYAMGGGAAGKLRCIHEWPHEGQYHRYNLSGSQRTSRFHHPAQPNQEYIEWALSPWEKDRERLVLLEALLRDLEWSEEASFTPYGVEHYCPSCGNEQRRGHLDKCELARLLRDD